MSKEIKPLNNQAVALIAPMLLGLVSGFIALFSIFAIRGAWEGFIRYNKGLSLANDMHTIVLSFLLFAIIGILCINLSLSFSGHRKRSLFIGILTAAIAFACGLAYLNTDDRSALASGTFYEFFTNALSVNQLYLLMTMLVYVAVAFCGSLAYARIRKAFVKDRRTVDEKQLCIKVFAFLAIAIVIISILPLAAVAAAKGMGIMEKASPASNDLYGPLINVSVQRINNSSIMITNEGGPDSTCLRNELPFTIYITPVGKEASNMEIASGSGLSVTITPAGGLENRAGAYVNITGRDVERDAPANVEYQSVHVAVMGHFKDGSNAILAQADI